MEEMSSSTGWMKKVVIGLVLLVLIVGVSVALFSSQDTGECATETEVVSPVDMDAEASPF